MDEQARALHERGFVCLEALAPAALTDACTRAMEAIWERLGRPALFSRADVWHAPEIHVSPVGLTRAGILDELPVARELLLRPELLGLFAAALGPGFALELGAGVLSDHGRPFFFWHHHVGGIDGEDYRKRPYPTFGRCERVACTLYACPLDDDHGVMLVAPRRVEASTAPPHPPGAEPWPEAVELRAPTGSVVVLDQGTWHAVTPMRRPGRRVFVAFFVRRAGLPPAVRRDPSLARALARDPALARAYGGMA